MKFESEFVGPVMRSSEPPVSIFDMRARAAGENAAEEGSVGRSGV
jgi:hypothetical protein